MKRTALLAGVATLTVASAAFALTFNVANGSFAYDVYDIAVNGMLRGPVGFVGGIAAIVFGAISAIRAQILPAIPAILGGVVLLKADSIISSLNALV